jgi:hypothetical protein
MVERDRREVLEASARKTVVHSPSGDLYPHSPSEPDRGLVVIRNQFLISFAPFVVCGAAAWLGATASGLPGPRSTTDGDELGTLSRSKNSSPFENFFPTW